MLAGAGHAREAVAALSGLLTGRLAFGFVQPLRTGGSPACSARSTASTRGSSCG